MLLLLLTPRRSRRRRVRGRIERRQLVTVRHLFSAPCYSRLGAGRSAFPAESSRRGAVAIRGSAHWRGGSSSSAQRENVLRRVELFPCELVRRFPRSCLCSGAVDPNSNEFRPGGERLSPSPDLALTSHLPLSLSRTAGHGCSFAWSNSAPLPPAASTPGNHRAPRPSSHWSSRGQRYLR